MSLFAGGQAKTLMFVHINPEVNAIGETISTLKFAQRVASIELGAARSNKETGEIRDLKDEVSIATVSFSLCKREKVYIVNNLSFYICRYQALNQHWRRRKQSWNNCV